MDRLIIILVAVLAFILGMLWNYRRWRISGNIYKSARKTFEENQELKTRNKIQYMTLLLKDKEIEELRRIRKCK